MGYRELEQRILSTDKILNGFEDAALVRVNAALVNGFRDLEQQLRRRWADAESTDVTGKQRAIILLSEIKAYLDILGSSENLSLSAEFNQLVLDAAATGSQFALGAMADVGPDGFVAGLPPSATAAPNLEAVAFQAQDGAQRLRRHSADFALRASKTIEAALVTGQGMQRTANTLRAHLGTTQAAAEMIVRTETISALDSATRAAYGRSGIELVQRIATADRRTCPYCADRAGKVYRLDQAPAALHPQDRCYNSPFSEAWLSAGLVDVEWLQDHRAELAKSLADRGLKPIAGVSPFEKLNGVRMPATVWEPPA